jgi:hypothetical protein
MISRQRKSAIRVAIAVALMGSAYALADEVQSEKQLHTLNAAYGFTTSVICVATPPEPPGTQAIDPSTLAFPFGGEADDATGGGTMTFKKDGTMTLEAPGNQLRRDKIVPGGVPFVNSIAGSCTGTYNITDDPKNGEHLIASYSCSLDEPTVDLKVAVGPVTWDAHIGPHANELHGFGPLNIQTIHAVQRSTGQALFDEQRICIQTVALDKLYDL